MSQIFVSYAAEDRERIKPLVDELSTQGSVWWDRDLVAGSTFEESIEQALEQARCVVVVWTEASVRSRWCRVEATDGVERGILVPLRIDDVRPPLSFRAVHTLDLIGWPRKRGELDEAISAVRALLAPANDPEAAPALAPASSSRKKWTWPAVGVAVLALISLLLITSGDLGQGKGEQSMPAAQRLAILPIRNLSPDDELDWIAGGLTEEIRQQMAAWGSFEVLPSVLVRGRSLAELEAEADLVIDGYLQRQGEMISVTLEAVSFDGELAGWQETFSARLDEPETLSRQIASNFARVFNWSATPTTPGMRPTNPRAYSAYLRYLHVGEYGNIDERLLRLENTLALDPDWTLGWLILSVQRLQLHFHLNDAELLAGSREALEHATQHDDRQDLWSWAWAWYVTYGEGDLESGESVWRAIAEAGFPAWYATLMVNSGLHAEAEAALARLLEQNPQESWLWEYLGGARANQGDFQGMLEAHAEIVPLNPPDSYISHGILGPSHASTGDFEAAHEHLAALQALATANSSLALDARDRMMILQNTIWQIALYEGDQAQATQIAEWFEREGMHANAAIAYLLLDDPRAAAMAERASSDPPYILMGWFQQTTLLNRFGKLDHPIVKQLQTQLGMTPEWRLELCRRAATLPPESGVACDPAKYATAAGP